MQIRKIVAMTVATIATLCGIVALGSLWFSPGSDIWWQALMSLGVIMTAGWIVLGALHYDRGAETSWMPHEAMMTLVGIFLILVTSSYMAIPTDYYSADTYLGELE